jgi:hypothetical protein
VYFERFTQVEKLVHLNCLLSYLRVQALKSFQLFLHVDMRSIFFLSLLASSAFAASLTARLGTACGPDSCTVEGNQLDFADFSIKDGVACRCIFKYAYPKAGESCNNPGGVTPSADATNCAPGLTCNWDAAKKQGQCRVFAGLVRTLRGPGEMCLFEGKRQSCKAGLTCTAVDSSERLQASYCLP